MSERMGSVPVVKPEIGHLEIPDYEPSYDDYIERCCHILKRHPGSSSSASTAPWTLCGLSLRRRSHSLMDGGAYACQTCGRARCPECADRFQRGQR